MANTHRPLSAAALIRLALCAPHKIHPTDIIAVHRPFYIGAFRNGFIHCLTATADIGRSIFHGAAAEA